MQEVSFFIYDPDLKLIHNYPALEQDLKDHTSPEFSVDVFIRPKAQ